MSNLSKLFLKKLKEYESAENVDKSSRPVTTPLPSDMGEKLNGTESDSESLKPTNSRDELISSLDKIEQEYVKVNTSNRLPEPPVYQRKEYDAPTDEEIKTKAESMLENERITGTEKIETDAVESKKSKEEEKSNVMQKAEAKQEEITDTYDNAIENYNSDVLKRGMARSSVASLGNNALQEAKAEALTLASNNAEAEVKAIDEEITALNESRQKALDAFNIAHAVKVTEKIAQLTEERNAKIEEATEYNNELLRQESEQAVDKIMKESDLQTEYLKQKELEEKLGTTDQALAEKNLAKYNTVRSYLLTLSKDEAKNAVKTDELVRSSLTDYYYYKLYNEFC